MISLFSSTAILALAAVASADVKFAPVADSLRHDLTGYFNPAYSNPNERLTLAISLKLKDAEGLQKFVDQINNPHSPLYHQFQTPEALGEKFGADQADVDFVVNYLKENGITVTLVGKSRTNIIATGTVAQMEQAFKTKIGYVDLGDGNIRTNLTVLQMPEQIAGKVLSIDGIDTSMRHKKKTTTTVFHPPLFWGCYNLTPAYASGFYGQGRNVAFANWDGLKLNNLPLWYSAYGMPTPASGVGSNVTIEKVGTGSTYYNTGTPQGEGDLDIQMETMSAPLANIRIYDDSTTDTAAPITTYTQIQNDNWADVVSESYGWSTYLYSYSRSKKTGTTTYYNATSTSAHNLHLLMSAQGITYLVASGDSGTAEFNNGGGTTSVTRYGYPDIDPEVLLVGGSEATVDSTTGVRSVEKSWGLNGTTAGTGGFDPYDTAAHGFAFNTPPAFQTSALAAQTTAHPYRLLPDVAAHAGGGDGVTTYAWIIYYNQGNSSYPLGTQVQISGTSAASPSTAGSLAIVEQRLFNGVTPNSTRSNVRLGRIADYLYLKGGISSVFYDITQGTTIGNLPGVSPTVAATPAVGWDYATGWGALNFDGLYHSYLQGKQP